MGETNDTILASGGQKTVAQIVIDGMLANLSYDRAKTELMAVAGADLADKLIKIVEDESNDVERRTAFLDTTAEEIAHGADYSKCETINDMCKVYANSLTTRLGF